MMNLHYLYMISCFISILIIFLNTPFHINLTLIFQTIIISLILGLTINYFWFSLLFFLIFIGGLMILFLYVTSMLSNKINLISMFSLNNLFIILTIFIMFYWFYPKINWMNHFFSINFDNTFSSLLSSNSKTFFLNKIFNKYSFYMTFMLMNYLLLTMIICIKIINFYQGPIRIKF
uniref:NADH dehydrogenase subunit 6 n=1 Tax=Marilia sp. XG-2021 TaxID=2996736 RepID=A0A9E8LP00_9NEOP|nr:NADH dehydrogenase subunit 6 [Marilia sp. XG-2021]